MAKEHNNASDKLYSIADDSLDQARTCRIARNVFLGLGIITELIIGVVDLAGADYNSPTISPYIVNGGGWFAVAGIAHLGAWHWERISEDFREGARDIGVLDTYTNPNDWDRQLPED